MKKIAEKPMREKIGATERTKKKDRRGWLSRELQKSKL
jgi:hypothetical protein